MIFHKRDRLIEEGITKYYEEYTVKNLNSQYGKFDLWGYVFAANIISLINRVFANVIGL
jgi:hypothetical protein